MRERAFVNRSTPGGANTPADMLEDGVPGVMRMGDRSEGPNDVRLTGPHEVLPGVPGEGRQHMAS